MNEADQNENLNTNTDGSKQDNNGSWPQLHSLVKHSLDPNFDRHISRQNGKEVSVYRSSHHAKSAFDIMNEMRKINMLTDITLLTDDGSQMSAHKMILSSCSPYFYAMFGNFGEREKNHVLIKGIDYAILKLLINFLYSTQIHITECNVQSLLAAANLLQLTVVVNACSDFLLRQLHPSNCLGIRAFASQYDCLELLAHVDGYIEHYLPEIRKYDEFFALSAQQLVSLISNDRLAVSSEELLFEYVISWINHNREKRKEYFENLIEHVRLPLITQKYLLEKVWEEKLVKENSQAKDYFIEALKYHLLEVTKQSSFETPRTKPREPNELPKLLVVVGGKSLEATRSVECYDFRINRWYPLSQLPTDFCGGGITLLKGQIYAVGGCTSTGIPLGNMNVYDPATDQWSGCTEMKIKRINLGIATLNNIIYAIGGWSEEMIYRSCEAYDPETQKWTMIPPMPTLCSDFAVGVLNGKLYVAGGYGEKHKQNLADVLSYDSETGEWSRVMSLITPRRNAGAGVINGILYVVGGQSDIGILKSVEAYDPRINNWKQVKDMPEGRKYVAVAGFGKHLYVAGGEDGTRYFKSVNVYCPESDTWEVLQSSMSIERGPAGVAIINKPHNYI